jgi:hypothetical protein
MKLYNPGDKLFYLCNDNQGSFVIPVTIIEVNNIYTDPIDGMMTNFSIWENKYLNQKTVIYKGSTFIDESYIENLTPVNQFVWIDEPVGHGLWPDKSDGLFTTLNEALKYAVPSRKKRLRLRLKKYRRSFMNFIARTWLPLKHPGFKRYADKKGFIKRK